MRNVKSGTNNKKKQVKLVSKRRPAAFFLATRTKRRKLWKFLTTSLLCEKVLPNYQVTRQTNCLAAAATGNSGNCVFNF